MCLHQDAGCLGTAVPDRAYERRLLILKEFGTNAIRCSHNPPSPEFLNYCDSIGFLVIDEAFDKWKSGYYEEFFDSSWQQDISDMVIRDRNHPSVILWSIGNELAEAKLKMIQGLNVLVCCRILYINWIRAVLLCSLCSRDLKINLLR